MNKDLTGVLLIGGSSRRFGSPKALAGFDRETLAERAWRLLRETCGERIAVGKLSDGLVLPFEVLDDGTTTQAPLVGLIAGLRAATNDLVVVVPVDCPLLRADDLTALVEACADAAVTQTGPLPGAYRKTALPALERHLASGELTLRGALDELETTIVTLEVSHLANANTPDELTRLAIEREPGKR